MRYLIKITLAASACSSIETAPDGNYEESVLDGGTPDGVDIGSAQQPLFMPLRYGMEDDLTECSPPWAGGKCHVPDRRTQINIVTDASACVNSSEGSTFWAKAFLESANKARDSLNALGGWQVFVNAQPLDVFLLKIHCSTGTSGTKAGVTVIDTSFDDCHDTEFGDVCQFGFGNHAYIYRKYLEGLPAWAAATATQRRNVARNVTYHEIMHSFGLGHPPGQDQPGQERLMSSGFNVDPSIVSISKVFNTIQQVSAEQKGSLDCYNESSSTTDRCGPTH